MNMHESERIVGLLDEASFAPVADGVQPGVVFSNRAVRKNADNKLAGNLDHLKRVKHRSPGMQIAVGLRRMFSLAGRDAVEILVFEVALGPLENALNSLGRFQMSTTRQGRTAVRRVGYRARLPTCSRLVDAQVGGAQRTVRRTRSVAPSRLLAASRPSVDHEHDR